MIEVGPIIAGVGPVGAGSGQVGIGHLVCDIVGVPEIIGQIQLLRQQLNPNPAVAKAVTIIICGQWASLYVVGRGGNAVSENVERRE
jgi:hypothetical protein